MRKGLRRAEAGLRGGRRRGAQGLGSQLDWVNGYGSDCALALITRVMITTLEVITRVGANPTHHAMQD